MACGKTLRVHQQVHGACRAGRVGRILRRLAVEPQVAHVHRQCACCDKDQAESEHKEYQRLARLVGRRAAFLQRLLIMFAFLQRIGGVRLLLLFFFFFFFFFAFPKNLPLPAQLPVKSEPSPQ